MTHPICQFLDIFANFFSHLWDFIIFNKPSLWASLSCLLSNLILPIRDVFFMYTMLIDNTWKYLWIILHFCCDWVSLFFSVFYSLCMPVRNLLELDLYLVFSQGIRSLNFFMVSKHWGFSIYQVLHQNFHNFKLYRVEELSFIYIIVHPVSYPSLKKILS